MIDFACRTFKIEDVIRCSFGLGRSDYRLFNFLLYQDRQLTTNEISKKTGLDRTTIQKSVKKLVEKNLVVRLQENLSRGGYLFKYMIKDKDILKKNIVKIIKDWSVKAEEEINRW